jgi:hypothetical protein
MTDLEHPFLWLVQSRNGRRYPFYRRNGQLIALKVPITNPRLKGELGANQRLHASFEADERGGSPVKGPEPGLLDETAIETFYSHWSADSIERAIFNLYLDTGQRSGLRSAGKES